MPWYPAGSLFGEFDAEGVRGGRLFTELRSKVYEEGVSGWLINSVGDAEFNNIVARGTITAGAGSDVDWSYISNVTIDNADITNLSFSKITAATNTATLTVGGAGRVQSSNFSSGSAGWRILGNGNAEFNNVTVRGVIEATSGAIDGMIIVGNSGGIRTQDFHFPTTVSESVFGWEAVGSGIGSRVSANQIRGEQFVAHNYQGSVPWFAPSYSFRGDEDTGLYRAGTNIVGLATAGERRWEVSSNGSLYNAVSSAADPNDSTARIMFTNTHWGLFYRNNIALFIGRSNQSNGPVVEIRRFGLSVGTISVTSTGTQYNTTSDRRLKDNIVPHMRGLDTIGRFNVRDYTWRSDGSADTGLIAQEVEQVLPQLVSENGEGMKVIDYGRITPWLIAAVQELSKEVTDLRAKLEEFTSKE